MRVLLGGRLEIAIVQRRRKPRSKPRDVFSGSGQPQKKAPQHPNPEVNRRPVDTPPAKPIPKKKIESEPSQNTNKESKKSSKKNIANADKTKDIIESQILGDSKKTLGLRNKSKVIEVDVKDNVTSKRAQDIIDKSRARAKQSLVKKPTSGNAKPTTPAPAPKRRPRKTKNSFQPAERKRRLDRSRHVEYKYEVRRLLVDLNVEEDQRSSILGTVWAKGERQTVSEAKDYLSSKHSEGLINDKQLDALNKIVDGYTIRR